MHSEARKATCPPSYGPELLTKIAGLLWVFGATSLVGCYTPLTTQAVPASTLPGEFRTPVRTFAPRMNFANLAITPPADYILGANDTLDVLVFGLVEDGEPRPMRTRIMADGTVTLPLVDEVPVGGMNLAEAQRAIDQAYAERRLLVNPRVSVTLAEKATISVAVMGEVASPGVYSLPRYENDVAHALAMAGGFTIGAAEVVEVHRRRQRTVRPAGESAFHRLPPTRFAPLTTLLESVERRADSVHRAGPADRIPVAYGESFEEVLRIPLRAEPAMAMVEGDPEWHELSLSDAQLEPGNIVVVPRQPDPVFYVVGLVDRNNAIVFSVTDNDRRLGGAFLLPNDRDIDVVSAVSMAGYIDPIISPSTVTVHRVVPGGPPFLIHVDLIKARYDWQENVYVQPGDIIYLNPDPQWWMRRTFDRIVPDLLTIPYAEAMERWINPFGIR